MRIEPKAEIIIVTGLSGAGRSTCLKLLEDYNFEAIDNLPLTLMSNLFSPLISNSETEPQKKMSDHGKTNLSQLLEIFLNVVLK